jgi:membrane protease YdiL (CAAX protease family)
VSAIPPPPPPGARRPEPAGGPPPGAAAGPDPAAPVPPGAHRTRQRRSLKEVRSPYGLWIAFFSVLIFVAPNLAVLGISGIDGLETAVLESTTMIVVNLVAGLVLQVVMFGFALLPLLAAGRPYSRVWGPTRTTGAMIGIGVAVGAAVVVVSYVVNIVVVLLVGVEDPVQQRVVQQALTGGLPLLLVALLAVVLAPIAEEVIFRGVLFRALADRINLPVGLVLSSAIFTGIHIEVVASQPFAMAGLFAVGFLLAWAYHLTGNLMVAIIGHAVFNAFSLGLAVLADRLDLEELLEDLTEVAVASPWLVASLPGLG